MDKSEAEVVPDARGYNELMDVYSLHQLMIRRGTLLEQTPEFVSFKRTYIQKWGTIAYVLHLLEKLMAEHQAELCYIEGRKVAELANDNSSADLTKYTKEQLFGCVVNQDEVGTKVKVPALMFKGVTGPILAATVIQKNWRMHKSRVAYTYLKFLMGKATIIQRYFRLYMF